MKEIFNIRIPSLCICFTLVVLLDLLYSSLFCEGFAGAKGFFLIFLLCVLCQLADLAVSRLNFRRWLHYCLAESALFYVLCLAFCALVFWNGLTLQQVASFSAVFLLVDISVFFYFRKRQQLTAEEINDLLRRRDGSSL